jgi:hypothetical protein
MRHGPGNVCYSYSGQESIQDTCFRGRQENFYDEKLTNRFQRIFLAVFWRKYYVTAQLLPSPGTGHTPGAGQLAEMSGWSYAYIFQSFLGPANSAACPTAACTTGTKSVLSGLLECASVRIGRAQGRRGRWAQKSCAPDGGAGLRKNVGDAVMGFKSESFWHMLRF